ncbi:MAG TPA: aminoglycoside adenylyltransferase domain-containing protein [Nocardioides sp.]|nr:aminoglycoside adenylyltransferase domain-containing protein [Nocardioides sp.]
MLNPHPTRYAELNGVLHDLVTSAQDALGESFVGAYLQGSFALGAGDVHSDCDFLVVVRGRPDAAQEAALRTLHRDLPHRPGYWNRHLEGSYAVAEDLRTTAGLGAEWLYVDHGADELQWSAHCNQPWTRWILREHGVTLVGPCPVDLVAPVPEDVLREEARAGLATLVDDVLGWCPANVAWCQRYLVVQAARSLYTVRTAQVASKRDALRWAMMHGDPRWRPLLQQVQADRDRGFDPDDVPRPGSLEAARAFASYALSVA